MLPNRWCIAVISPDDNATTDQSRLYLLPISRKQVDRECTTSRDSTFTDLIWAIFSTLQQPGVFCVHKITGQKAEKDTTLSLSGGPS